MQLKRVAITGIGAISGLGSNVSSLIKNIKEGKSAVRYMEGWDKFTGLRSLVGAPAVPINEKAIPRQRRRSMGKMSIFAALAAEEAIANAGISKEELSSGRTGCIIGSTMGSAKSLNEAFEIILLQRDISQLPSMKFFQCVSHSAAMNVSQYFGISGYVMAPCAACASAIHAIGASYDLIRLNRADVILCGGAEEIHPTVTGSFDILNATSSKFNNTPHKTPRPFDINRDGLVCGEGSGILVLEEYERAQNRNAHIYAEIIGYNTAGNGNHISQSSKEAMILCMKKVLCEASIGPSDIDYINAHATATIQGDEAEASAIREVFGSSVPVSSLKGYVGHTLGASGAIELIISLVMMREGKIFPTLNLETVSPNCDGINHVIKMQSQEMNILVKNCFAFGGINAALVCKKVDH